MSSGRSIAFWGGGVLAFAMLCPGIASPAPRESIGLNGEWQFRLDPSNRGESERWYAGDLAFPRKIEVPGAWQAQGVGEPEGILRHHYAGAAWYRRVVDVPESWRGRVAHLRIGGVHRSATVYINGVNAGKTDIFSAPVTIDITRALRPGASNRIAIRVENPPAPLDVSPDKQAPLLPTGMLNYIGNWGGFYGDVSLESTSRAWIDSSLIASDVAKGRITVRVHVASAGATAVAGLIRVSARGRTADAPVKIPASGEADATVELPLPDAPLWSPEHPELTTASIEVLVNGKTMDRADERFGFRTVSTEGNRVLLNGKPIYLRGYGDDNVEVLTGFPPASKDVYLKRLAVAKSLGFNAVRFHSMTPPRAYFDAADEAGLLVMAELPAAYTQFFYAHRDHLKRELKSVLLAYRNHPSLLSLGFGNEFNLNWLKNDEERRVFTSAIAEFYRYAKELAPATLIMSNDGFDLRPTDMVSIGRFAPPDRPTIRHEFGAYYCSLPDISLIDRFTGVMKPVWLEAKREWVEQHGLTAAYASYLRNSQRLQQLGHKYQIERARADNAVSGYDYWLIVDYPGGTGEGDSWEEGWLDYFWRPKIAPEEGREWNSPVLLMINAGVDDRSFWTDRPKTVSVSVSNYGPAAVREGTLEWTLSEGRRRIGGGELRGVSAPLAEISTLGNLTLDAAGLTQAARLELALTLRTANGVYSNRWSFWAYPPAGRMPAPATPVVSSLRWEGLRRAFPWIHPESGSAAAGELLITDALNHDAMARLRAGGRVWLMLDDSAQRRGVSFFPASGGAMGTLVADHPALAGFPHDDFCDLQCFNLLDGAYPLPVDNWPSTLSPIIGGIRTTAEFLSKTKALSRVAYAVEANVGEGKLLITTLRLRPRFDEAYPEAMSVFQSLLRYAAGSDFHPAGQLSGKDLQRLIAE
jgi:hypothetical protein